MKNLTRQAMADSLRTLLRERPLSRISVRDITEGCHVNRQTFYYHFNDVYDLMEWVFEQDANCNLPAEIDTSIAEGGWKECVRTYFQYLVKNKVMVLNIYDSQNRAYMLHYFQKRLRGCIQGYCEIVSRDMSISWADMEFVVEFYLSIVIGLIDRWLDNGMELPPSITVEKCRVVLEGSIEYLLNRFQIH